MIHAENLSRRYGDFAAVDNVSFNISAGEIVGLLGHNGAGKTTIMKMLTGYLEPSDGKITINGLALDSDPNNIQQDIGYLPENLPVYHDLSVMDYLFYCAQVRNIPEEQQDTAVSDAIRQTELGEKALQPIATLSRGYKQRVGVAQALIHNPKILILDEPTNGLDPHQTQQMRNLIRNLANHATVIISTHIMQEVDALCDRVLILDSGQLAVDESMEQLRKSDTIALHSSVPQSTLQALVKEKDKTLIVKSTQEHHFQIAISESTDANALCAWLAEKLVTSGERVFAISPQLRDLETVFRNIHEHKQNMGDVSNAA
ncbi:ABC-2 type transport system ATP-binding protein [Alteromonadaceae bacterium 2753L.S.0a.02]|nr:ABC-2 type transport system ATP-binding protein [Alteromonadaceae bacterium 2753L.S.0a.02]